MTEIDFTFDSERRQEISRVLVEDRLLSEFSKSVYEVSYRDGYKVYFENGWIIARSSGTGPLLHIFCEMSTQERVEQACEEFRKFLGLQIVVSAVYDNRCYNRVVRTPASLG